MARFFTKAFEVLDSLSGGTIFNVDGNLITPRDERVRLITLDVLKCGSPSFVAIYPDATRRELSEIARAYENASILVQAFRTGDVRDSVSSRVNYVTEHLGVLISTLHLRARGYMIGSGNYGSVDDVVAWRSPLLDKLRTCGFIDRGCTQLELSRLRWVTPPRIPCSQSSSTRQELVLVEAERSPADALSNTETKGLNQLHRALHEDVASGLCICFPLTGEGDETPDCIRAAIDGRWRGGSKIGSVLFDDNGLYINPPDDIAAAQRDSEIHHLESQLKQTILANFDFTEILELARKANIDLEDRGWEDVGLNLKREIAERADVTLILDALDQIIPQ